MKSFKIDTTGDLLIQDNNIIFTSNEKEDISQSVKIILNINLNEWFLNGNLGFDFEVLMRKQYDEREIINALETAIYKELRVNEVIITSLVLNRHNRIMSIKGNIIDINNNEINLSEIGGVNIE